MRTLNFKLVRRLLDEMCERDSEGRDTLNGHPVDYKDRCVVARWLVGPFRNRKAEEFALRLDRLTGCIIADRQHARLIDQEGFLADDDRIAG